jgi:hypothetical protein
MFLSPLISVYYFGLKTVFFYGLVHSFVKFEPLQKHWVFISLLYIAGVALLSWVFLLAPGLMPITTHDWGVWLVKYLLISLVYFKLLSKFDEGILFWILVIGGVAVVWY